MCNKHHGTSEPGWPTCPGFPRTISVLKLEDLHSGTSLSPGQDEMVGHLSQNMACCYYISNNTEQINFKKCCSGEQKRAATQHLFSKKWYRKEKIEVPASSKISVICLLYLIIYRCSLVTCHTFNIFCSCSCSWLMGSSSPRCFLLLGKQPAARQSNKHCLQTHWSKHFISMIILCWHPQEMEALQKTSHYSYR